jgi:hypothetical protein
MPLFRYIADYVFALPTVAFFMTAIGIFILGHVLSSYILGYRRFRGPSIWRKCIAVTRYLSYRGFHIRALRWNSAPVGVLLLGLAGTLFFICTFAEEDGLLRLSELITDSSYGSHSPAILLGRHHVRRFTAISYPIRMDGTGMHALRLVRCLNDLTILWLLTCSVPPQPRRTGSRCSPEFPTRDCRSFTDGAHMLSLFLRCFTRFPSLYIMSTGMIWRCTSPQVSSSTGPVLSRSSSRRGLLLLRTV